jgi:hypothetical protein
MKKLIGNDLFTLVRDYLKDYLPKQRNFSRYTFRQSAIAYEDGYENEILGKR